MSSEPSLSLGDVQLLSLLDTVLVEAIKLWRLRPVPAQRLSRQAFAEAFTAFWRGLNDEEREAVFPETKHEFDTHMTRLRF